MESWWQLCCEQCWMHSVPHPAALLVLSKLMTFLFLSCSLPGSFAQAVAEEGGTCCLPGLHPPEVPLMPMRELPALL